MKILSVAQKDAGMRLDKYLLRVLDRAPRGFVYKHLRKKNIKLDGCAARGDELLSPGSKIELYFSDEVLATLFSDNATCAETPAARRIPDIGEYCEIVYEDDLLIIANKKAGVLSQKAGPHDVSLNEALRAYLAGPRGDEGRLVATKSRRGCVFSRSAPAADEKIHSEHQGCAAKDSGPHERPEGAFRPSIMNRLDRNTSGLVVFALSYASAVELARIFREGAVGKYYLAISEGAFDESVRRSEGWLIKESRSNTVRILDHEAEGADRICNEYELLRVFSHEGRTMSLLRVRLMSGKTHQIRASLASLGHPILGDHKYGGTYPTASRALFLHAYRIVFPADMRGELGYLGAMSFTAPLPAHFSELLGGAGIDINSI